jgi:DNA repair photolyase
LKKRTEYREKLQKFIPQTLYGSLDEESKQFIKSIAEPYQFTFQEFRQVTEFARDLAMWGEEPIHSWWPENIPFAVERKNKSQALKLLKSFMDSLKGAAKSYPAQGLERPKKREKGKIVLKESEKNIFGWCPVASEKTVCCNLKTIDAVENCIFGCSYCTIQTFYKSETVFDNNLAVKLANIKLEKVRKYHIGTGQSSDSLAWGNKHGNLDALCKFAEDNPNILLEFKTKSDNISYFLENKVPANIVCSWSLNPQTIIDNEEHFTASLENRLKAARLVADKGVKVAFHFHPIIYYSDWQTAYPEIARRLQEMFTPDEVLFISFGSVTFIKPVLKKIRKLGFPTKITQMELVTDPHGKMTYPDEIKIEKFSTMYKAFKKWHKKVFFYLCMEKAELWEKSLGYVYNTNEDFEQAMLADVFSKIKLEIAGR